MAAVAAAAAVAAPPWFGEETAEVGRVRWALGAMGRDSVGPSPLGVG